MIHTKFKKLTATNIIAFMLLIFIFGISMTDRSFASEKSLIVEATRDNKTIHLFTKGFSEKDDLSVLIGKKESKIGGLKTIKDGGTPIKTLILVDNSVKSVDESQSQFSAFLESFIADKSSSEQIAISIFSDKIIPVIDYTDDYYTLITSSKQIGYAEQNTYLTDVLYNLVDDFANSEETCFQRIILLTDGCEDESVGVTREELFDTLKEFPIPIYVLGCKIEGNLNELESVFALSRKTGASSYILNDIENKLEIAEELKKDEDILRISIVLDDSIMDGSEKTVKISNGQSSASIDIRMPQSVARVEEKVEDQTNNETKNDESKDIITIDIGSENDVLDEIVIDDMVESKSDISIIDFILKYWIWFAVGLAVLLLLTVLIVLLVVFKKKKTSNEDGFVELGYMPAPDLDTEATVKVNFAPDTENSSTVKLWENKNYYISLRDINRPEMEFRQMVNGAVTIGRNHSKNMMVIDYDKSISGQHCCVTVKDGVFYVADSGSSNGTFVNNEKISSETAIKTGDVLTLGQSAFTFEGSM